jgi:hypothetical protein
MATPNDLWPNRNVKATVVDTDPPQSNTWSEWAPTESSQSAWSTPKKKSQRAPRRTSPTTQPAAASGRPVGRWIAAAALWTLAGGLFAGRAIAPDVDAGVEAGMDWLAVRAPSFVRPYLPKPVPKLIEPRPHKQTTPSLVFPDRSTSKEPAHAAGKEDRGRRHR